MPIRPPEIDIQDIEQFQQEQNQPKRTTTHKETWKAFERKVSADFGTTRTPLSGMVKTITNSDTLHKFIYVECKLRSNQKEFKFWDELYTHRKEAKKASSTQFPIYSILHKEELVILMDSADFFCLMKHTGKYDSLTLNLHNCKSVLSLYKQTVERALIEEKTPVICLKKKGKPGYLIGTHPKNIEVLQKLLK